MQGVASFIVHALLAASVALSLNLDACAGKAQPSSNSKTSPVVTQQLTAKQIRRGETKGSQVVAIPADKVKIKGKKVSPATIVVFTDTSNDNAYYVRMDNEIDGLRFMTLSASAVRGSKTVDDDRDAPGLYNEYAGYVRVVLPKDSKLTVFGTIKVGTKTVSVSGDTKVRRTG